MAQIHVAFNVDKMHGGFIEGHLVVKSYSIKTNIQQHSKHFHLGIETDEQNKIKITNNTQQREIASNS